MKIGIDIDDTLIYSLEDFLKFYNEKNNTRHHCEDNYSSMRFHEFLGITKDELYYWYKKYDITYNKNIKPIEGAKEILSHLIKSNEIVLITARPSRLKFETFEILKKHFPEFDFEVLFQDSFKQGEITSKGDICLDRNINLMIDDDNKNSLDCASKGIQVILFDKPWNKGVEHKLIKRVYNWKEIFKEIEKFNIKNGC